MLDLAIFTFTTLFATVGPVDTAIIFAGLSANYTLKHKRKQAVKGVLIGGAILLFFILFGDKLLNEFPGSRCSDISDFNHFTDSDRRTFE